MRVVGRRIDLLLIRGLFLSGAQLNPLLGPALAVPREGEYSNQPPGPIPTVGDAVVALREIQSHLNQSLVEVDSYSIKLLNQDSTGMDELEEVRTSFSLVSFADQANWTDGHCFHGRGRQTGATPAARINFRTTRRNDAAENKGLHRLFG